MRDRPLDEHLLDPADARLVPLARDRLHDVDEPLDPFALHLVGDLVGHRGRLGFLPRRVDEGEGAVVADLLDDLERLTEVLLGLAGEADDDVRRQREVGDRRAQLHGQPHVALARVRSAHRLEDPRRPDCSGRCACSQTDAHSAIASITGARKSFGCGDVKRSRSTPSTASQARSSSAKSLPSSRPYELTFWPSSVISLTPSPARRVTSATISPGRRETSRPRTAGTMQ